MATPGNFHKFCGPNIHPKILDSSLLSPAAKKFLHFLETLSLDFTEGEQLRPGLFQQDVSPDRILGGLCACGCLTKQRETEVPDGFPGRCQYTSLL